MPDLATRTLHYRVMKKVTGPELLSATCDTPETMLTSVSPVR